MTARAAFAVQIVIGAMFAAYGAFSSLLNFGVGVSVAAVGVLGYEFLVWENDGE